MNILLLFLSLAGYTSGLTSNLEYVYRYVGTVSTGINELSSQAAGATIKADIIIQVHNDGSALIKLNNVDLVEFNDKLGCDSRGEVPELFEKPFSNVNEKLLLLMETPFKAHFFDNNKHALEVDASESVWISNVRKAIVSHLKIELLKANFDAADDDIIASRIQSGKVPHVFHLQEETILGKCRVNYAVHKLREDLSLTRSYNYGQSIEEDVERGEIESSAYTSKTSQKTSKTGPSKTSKTTATTKTKTSGTKNGKPSQLIKKIKDDLWHVIRSTDFNECDERVFLQTTPTGVPRYTKQSMADGQFKWLRGRSSVSEYILRGSGGHFRVERAVVEGSTSMAPLGLKSELLQARTNQTFHLVAVRKAKEILNLPANPKYINSWMQEVLSFAAYPVTAKAHPWITYTGKPQLIGHMQTFGLEPLTLNDSKSIKDWIIIYLRNASDILADTNQAFREREPGITIQYLQRSSELMSLLSKEANLDIFELFFGKKVHPKDLGPMLAIDAAAASGSFNAVEAVIDYMKAGKLSDPKIMTIFMALTNHAECPCNIPSLMDYVLSLNFDEKPILTSTILINFANFLNQICIAPNSKQVQYAGALFGDRACNSEIINDRFLPYLKGIITSDVATWKKEVAVKALGKLASPLAVPILTSVILGGKYCCDSLRKTAILALEGWKLKKFTSSHLKENIIDVLTDVYTNVGEKSSIRQMALLAVPSWSPDASFWYQVARATWREPSRAMATVMTTMLESYSNMINPHNKKLAQAASHAVKFARPVSPSAKYSFVYATATEKAAEYVRIIQEFARIYDGNKYQSNDILMFLMSYIGGYQLTEFELTVMEFNAFSALHDFIKKHETEGPASDVSMKVAKRFFKSINETLQAKTDPFIKNSGINIFMRFFDHMHFFAPLNKQTINADGISLFWEQLIAGTDFSHIKFFNPIKGKTFQPTEMGLPLFSKFSNPMVISGVTHAFVRATPQPNEENEFYSDCLYNFASESKSSLEVLIPWKNVHVGTGLRSTRDIVAPIKSSQLLKFFTATQMDFNYFSGDLQFSFKNKFSAIQASNYPYTSISPILPIPQSQKSNIQLILSNNPPKETKIHFQTTSIYTGIQFDLTWLSEMRFPINLFDIKSFLSTCKDVIASPWLLYSLTSPTVHMWNLKVEFDPAASDTKNISFEFTKSVYGAKESGELTQQKGDDDYSQSKQDTFDQYDQSQNFDVDQGLQEFSEISPKIPPEIETFGGQVIYGDTQQKRAEKLQKKFEGVVISQSLKFKLNGITTRNYEIMFTNSEPTTSESRKLIKSQLSFFRGPIPGIDPKSAAVYLDIKKSTPEFSNLDTLESLFSTNLDTELQAEVTIQSSPEPIFSLKGNFRLSEAWKAKYQKELKEACNFDSFNPLHAFHANTVYDLIKLTASWKKICDYDKLPILSTAFWLLDNAMIAHVLLDQNKCGSSEPSSKITVDGHRCPITAQWDVDVTRGESKLELNGVENCPLINQYLSIGNMKHFQLHPSHYSTFNLEAESCSIRTSKTANQVRTFDGYTYDVKLSDCWTVAAHVCDRGTWYLVVRSSQEKKPLLEVKYVNVINGLVVDITDHVKINGKKIDPVGYTENFLNSEGDIFATVLKKNDFYEVQLDIGLIITVRDEVQISVPQNFAGILCGLCGNYDGEPEGDLIGPDRCIYGNPNTFAASWMAESDTCDLYTLLEKREDVDNFQKVCTRIDQLRATCGHYEERSFDYEWATYSENGNYCVSAMPLRYCKDDAISFDSPKLPVTFRCWVKKEAPKSLIDACDKKLGHTTSSMEKFEANAFEQVKQISIPTTCIKS